MNDITEDQTRALGEKITYYIFRNGLGGSFYSLNDDDLANIIRISQGRYEFPIVTAREAYLLCANAKKLGQNKIGHYTFEAFDARGETHRSGPMMEVWFPDLDLVFIRHDTPQGCRWSWREYNDESAMLLKLSCQSKLNKFKEDLKKKIEKNRNLKGQQPYL